MNKALLLLLVTLLQSQSNGILLSGPKHSNKIDDNIERFQSEEWDSSESPFSYDVNREFRRTSQAFNKRSGNDALTRRSVIHKNFMRFGRNFNPDNVKKYRRAIRSDVEQSNSPNFLRFTRSMRDKFIRFGRGPQDNFMRFGRRNKENDLPLERLNADNFLRTGKSARESFMRFGKGDQNFLRFGREKPATKNCDKSVLTRNCYSPFGERTIKFDETSNDFERFGEFRPPDIFFSPVDNQSEEKNETSFLSSLIQDARNGVHDEKQLALDEDNKDMNLGLVIRIKRNPLDANTNRSKSENRTGNKETTADYFQNVNESGRRVVRADVWKNRDEASASYFEKVPQYFPKKISRFQNIKSLGGFGNLKYYNRLITPPFFPVASNY